MIFLIRVVIKILIKHDGRTILFSHYPLENIAKDFLYTLEVLVGFLTCGQLALKKSTGCHLGEPF